MSTCRARWAGSPACYPVRLDPGALDLDEALAGGPALGRALKPIKEQLRALPDHGLGYGLLRYLNAEHRHRSCAGCAAPQIGFNYLGRFRRAAARTGPWPTSAVRLGGRRSGDAAGACARDQCADARWSARARG